MTSIQQNLVVPNPENAQSNQNQPPAASSPSKLRLKQALQDLKAEEAQKHEKLISLVEQVTEYTAYPTKGKRLSSLTQLLMRLSKGAGEDSLLYLKVLCCLQTWVWSEVLPHCLAAWKKKNTDLSQHPLKSWELVCRYSTTILMDSYFANTNDKDAALSEVGKVCSVWAKIWSSPLKPYIDDSVIQNQVGLLYEYAERAHQPQKVRAGLRATFKPDLLGQILGSSRDFSLSVSVMELLDIIAPVAKNSEARQAHYSSLFAFLKDGRAGARPGHLDVNAKDTRSEEQKKLEINLAKNLERRIVQLVDKPQDYFVAISEVAHGLGEIDPQRPQRFRADKVGMGEDSATPSWFKARIIPVGSGRFDFWISTDVFSIEVMDAALPDNSPAHNNSSGFDVKFSSMERIDIHSDRFVIITTNPIEVPSSDQQSFNQTSRALSVFTDSANLERLEETLKHRKVPVINAEKEKNKASSKESQVELGEHQKEDDFGEYLHLANQEDDENRDQNEEDAGLDLNKLNIAQDDDFGKDIPSLQKDSKRKQSQAEASLEQDAMEEDDGVSDDEELIKGDAQRKAAHLKNLARLDSVAPEKMDVDQDGEQVEKAAEPEEDQEMKDGENEVPKLNLIPATATQTQVEKKVEIQKSKRSVSKDSNTEDGSLSDQVMQVEKPELNSTSTSKRVTPDHESDDDGSMEDLQKGDSASKKPTSTYKSFNKSKPSESISTSTTSKPKNLNIPQKAQAPAKGKGPLESDSSESELSDVPEIILSNTSVQQEKAQSVKKQPVARETAKRPAEEVDSDEDGEEKSSDDEEEGKEERKKEVSSRGKSSGTRGRGSKPRGRPRGKGRGGSASTRPAAKKSKVSQKEDSDDDSNGNDDEDSGEIGQSSSKKDAPKSAYAQLLESKRIEKEAKLKAIRDSADATKSSQSKQAHGTTSNEFDYEELPGEEKDAETGTTTRSGGRKSQPQSSKKASNSKATKAAKAAKSRSRSPVKDKKTEEEESAQSLTGKTSKMKKKNQPSSVLGVPEVASEKGGSSRGNSVSASRSESPSKSKMAGSDDSRSTKRVDRVLEPKLDVPQAQRGRGSPAAAKPATAVWMHQNHKKRLEKEAEAARQSMAVEQEEQEEGSRAAAQSIDDGSGVQPMDQDLPPMDSPPPQEDEEMEMEEEIEVAAEKKVQEQEPEPQVENRAPPSRQPGTKPPAKKSPDKSTSAQVLKPTSNASREESDAMDVEGEEEKEEEEEVPIARKTRAHRAVAVEKQALQTESTPIRAKASSSKAQGSGKMKAAPSVSKHQASSPTAPGSIPTDSEPHDSLSAQLRMNIDNNIKNNEVEKKKKAHKSPVEKEVIYQAPPGQVAIPEGEYQRYLEYRSKKQSPAQKAATVVEEEKENENGKDGEDVEMAIMEDDGDTTFVDMEIDPKPSQSQGLRRKVVPLASIRSSSTETRSAASLLKSTDGRKSKEKMQSSPTAGRSTLISTSLNTSNARRTGRREHVVSKDVGVIIANSSRARQSAIKGLSKSLGLNEKSGKEKEKDKDKAVQPSRELRKVDKVEMALTRIVAAVMRHTREDLANRESASQARGQKLMKVISDTLKELSIESYQVLAHIRQLEGELKSDTDESIEILQKMQNPMGSLMEKLDAAIEKEKNPFVWPKNPFGSNNPPRGSS